MGTDRSVMVFQQYLSSTTATSCFGNFSSSKTGEEWGWSSPDHPIFLFFHAAFRQPTHKVFFDQGEQDHDRQGGQEGGCHHPPPHVMLRMEQMAEPEGQRHVFLGSDEHGGKQILIPRDHEHIYKDRHDGGQ